MLPMPIEGKIECGKVCDRSRSAIAQELVDAALQLALFLLALAQPGLKVGDRELGWRLRAECNADEIVAAPDHFGEEGTAFARGGQRYLLSWQFDDVAEFDLSAFFGDIADDAISGFTTFTDF